MLSLHKPEILLAQRALRHCLLLGCMGQSVVHLTQEPAIAVLIPGLATYLTFLLLLIQEEHLSITGEIMCLKY